MCCPSPTPWTAKPGSTIRPIRSPPGTSITTDGYAKFVIPATGHAGTHIVTLGHSEFGAPYMNPNQQPVVTTRINILMCPSDNPKVQNVQPNSLGWFMARGNYGANGGALIAFLAVIVLCGFAMVRVWRDQHTYGI